MPRNLDLVVVSDVHLGTPGSRAAELNAYLKSIAPRRLVLCGDIIDIWEFRKKFWPQAHFKVLRRVLKLAVDGVPVHYLTGNHDQALRRYGELVLGPVHLAEDLVLEVAGRKVWFSHGDLADRRLGTSRLLAWLGSHCYDAVTNLAIRANWLRSRLGLAPFLDPTARFKATWAAGHIARFESAMAALARDRGHDEVVCGHIHVPRQRELDGIIYRNCGDWVDSLSALECDGGVWRLVRFQQLVDDGLLEPPTLAETVAVPPVAA